MRRWRAGSGTKRLRRRACGSKEGATRRLFFGTTESRALTRFVVGLEKAAR
jgi:hypothetical protein